MVCIYTLHLLYINICFVFLVEEEAYAQVSSNGPLYAVQNCDS